MRIEGWNQEALSNAKVAVVSDDAVLCSLYVLSSAALGINTILALAPSLDDRLIKIAKEINPELNLAHVKGYYSHPGLDWMYKNFDILIDLVDNQISDKLMINTAREQHKPAIEYSPDSQGFQIFTYINGREWSEINRIISERSLPDDYQADRALSIAVAAIILEETKNLLMGKEASKDMIEYTRMNNSKNSEEKENISTPNPELELTNLDLEKKILIVGSGALGNFTGLALAYSGFKNITFIDPDKVEETNLNRQVMFSGKVGHNKSEALAGRINELFGTSTKSIVEYFRKETEISDYDILFDCVDNFETRIVLSEACKNAEKALISGGTNIDAGQVVSYVPGITEKTPAEYLGLYDIVAGRKVEEYKRERSSCTYRPDPSVIMTNQIIGAFMVEAYKRLLCNSEAITMFYDSNSSKKIGEIIISKAPAVSEAQPLEASEAQISEAEITSETTTNPEAKITTETSITGETAHAYETATYKVQCGHENSRSERVIAENMMSGKITSEKADPRFGAEIKYATTIQKENGTDIRYVTNTQITNATDATKATEEEANKTADIQKETVAEEKKKLEEEILKAMFQNCIY